MTTGATLHIYDNGQVRLELKQARETLWLTQMQIKRAYTKEQSRKKIVDEKYRKVFIVGLPGDLTEEETKAHFSKFGAV